MSDSCNFYMYSIEHTENVCTLSHIMGPVPDWMLDTEARSPAQNCATVPRFESLTAITTGSRSFAPRTTLRQIKHLNNSPHGNATSPIDLPNMHTH